jgi:hypothetical protein
MDVKKFFLKVWLIFNAKKVFMAEFNVAKADEHIVRVFRCDIQQGHVELCGSTYYLDYNRIRTTRIPIDEIYNYRKFLFYRKLTQ